MLRRSPGFSVLAFLCLTLGIDTNAAVLSWIEGILIRPYPLVPHQDRMFALIGTTRGVPGHNGLSYPDFVDLEKNSTLFESFIIDRITGTTLSVGDRAERASMGIVSANYFGALGVRPILGRGFRPEEAFELQNVLLNPLEAPVKIRAEQSVDPSLGRDSIRSGIKASIIGTVAVSGFMLVYYMLAGLVGSLGLTPSTANIGLTEIRFGALPAGGGTARAPRLIGLSHAKRLIMVGEPVGAEEAKRIGLVDEVCQPDELMPKVMELAKVLASRAPYAMKTAKQILNRTLQIDLASALVLERSMISRMATPEEMQEARKEAARKAGLPIDILTFDGLQTVKIPEGSQPGQRLRLKSLGASDTKIAACWLSIST